MGRAHQLAQADTFKPEYNHQCGGLGGLVFAQDMYQDTASTPAPAVAAMARCFSSTTGSRELDGVG